MPGFYVTDDRNYTYIGIRGFSRPTNYNNRMLLLLNRAAINEAVWGSSPMGSQLGINIDAIERVEIVRGPRSALYGTSAMFTVINIITRSGNQVDRVDAAVELGSFGTRSGSLTYGREFKTGLDLSISGIWEKRDGPDLYFAAYDDPSTNNGIAEDLDWEELYGVSARATYSNLAVQALFVGRDKGIPTGSCETDFNDSRSMSVDNYHLLNLECSRAISATSHLTARASQYYYYYAGDWPYETEVWPEDSDTRSLRAELQLRHDLRADNRLFGGVELGRGASTE